MKLQAIVEFEDSSEAATWLAAYCVQTHKPVAKAAADVFPIGFSHEHGVSGTLVFHAAVAALLAHHQPCPHCPRVQRVEAEAHLGSQRSMEFYILSGGKVCDDATGLRLAWSNTDGWVHPDSESVAVFSLEEMLSGQFDMPIPDGGWAQWVKRG
jgi:hypothetical protein